MTGPRGKRELIDFIIKQERFHPDLLFFWLDGDDMRELCEDMRLKTYGSKRVKWKRVLKVTNEFNGKFGK